MSNGLAMEAELRVRKQARMWTTENGGPWSRMRVAGMQPMWLAIHGRSGAPSTRRGTAIATTAAVATAIAAATAVAAAGGTAEPVAAPVRNLHSQTAAAEVVAIAPVNCV